MARGQQLNVKMIERLKEPGKYGDGRNLYLHVTKTGSKSWLFIYRRLGRDRMRGLGSCSADFRAPIYAKDVERHIADMGGACRD